VANLTASTILMRQNEGDRQRHLLNRSKSKQSLNMYKLSCQIIHKVLRK